LAKIGSGSYGALADRQGTRWDLVRKAGAEQRTAPCIALSRLPGAGGQALGRLLAEKLDYGFFGREVVEKVAEDLGLDHWVVRDLDETARSGIQRFLMDVISARPLSQELLLRKVTLAIATIGRRGGAVLVGRGAPFILTPETALRVLVVAPHEVRIERYAEKRGISSGDAERDMAFAEQQRAAFAERHFHVQQNDPLLYDIVLNTGTIQLEDAADLLIEALRRRFPDARIRPSA
jgi:cytidylate kinase